MCTRKRECVEAHRWRAQSELHLRQVQMLILERGALQVRVDQLEHQVAELVARPRRRRRSEAELAAYVAA